MRDDSVAPAARVAILLFDGVQIIDFTGPYEVFGQACFDVFTASKDGESISTSMGMSVNPDHALIDAPGAAVVVVPGGDIEDIREDDDVLRWLEDSAPAAQHVLSVCNGAFLLARAGLLDGKRATTYYKAIDELRAFAPGAEVVSDRRFVDNGKVIATAGLSSGIDGSLHLVERMLGRGRAQAVALHIEYDWNDDSDFARAALADRVLPDLVPPDGMTIELLRTEGDRSRWEIDWEVSGSDREEIEKLLRERLGDEAGWNLESSDSDTTGTTSRWTFVDDDRRRWSAVTRIGSKQDATERLGLSLRTELDRSGAEPASE